MSFRVLRKINKIVTSTVVAGILLVQPAVMASTYGSGNYGACVYSQGCPPPASSGSKPGASSGSPSPSTNTADQILLNDFSEYFTNMGKSLEMPAGQVIYFNISSAGNIVKYAITIKTVGANNVVFTIGTSPTEITLHLGEFRQFDANNDGQNDIEITLDGIKGGVATMTFRALSSAPQTPQVIAPIAVAATKAKGSSRLSLWLWLAFIVAALIIWLTLFLLRRRRREEESRPTWPNY